MSNQKLGILAVVAAVMVLWAAVQSRLSSRGGARVSGPSYLIQGLDPADINSITVGYGDDAVQIKRQGGRFVVANEAGYPADPKQINDLITKSLDVKTTEVYTDKPENHEELEVTEEKARHVVKFFKEDGSLLTGVVVGKSQEAGQSTFVRQAGDDTVWLSESSPYFRSRGLDYVNQEIVSVKREDVNAVTVTTPDGAYTLRPKEGGDGVIFEGLPDGKKLKESDAKSVFGALTSLRFDDVNRPGEIEGVSFDHLYVCRLDDSTEYKLNLGKKGDKTYSEIHRHYAGDEEAQRGRDRRAAQGQGGPAAGRREGPEIHVAAQGLGVPGARVEGEVPDAEARGPAGGRGGGNPGRGAGAGGSDPNA